LREITMRTLFLPCIGLLLLAIDGAAQVGTVKWQQKIHETAGGFGGALDSEDHFGSSLAFLSDLDGDGVRELAVGAYGDDDGGALQGAVWILFLNTDGTVKSEQKISETTGGFAGHLDPDDLFGSSVAALGDLDGDGVEDLAVGAPWDDDGGNLQGAVWILFLNADATVKSQRKISETAGGFGGVLAQNDNFGRAVAAVGDLDGDGGIELAVGAPNGGSRGMVWILFLNPDGTVKDERGIDGQSGLGGNPGFDAWFGGSLASIGDLDLDGTADVVVGAPADDNGGSAWIVFLNADGTVGGGQEISAVAGGFTGFILGTQFGISVTSPGDLDGDGTSDLTVGANHDGTDGYDQGAIWNLFLNVDGTVRSTRKVSDLSGNFGGDLDPGTEFWIPGDQFGWSLASPGDLNGDGVPDVAVGALWDDDGGDHAGAVWMLLLDNDAACTTLDFETEDDLVTPLVNGQHIDVEFGDLTTLSSWGPSAGIGVFDSTVGGPNDPGAAPELLVGTGNLLVRQTENFPPDANDVFPVPDDDEDDGTIAFDFVVPLQVVSVRLIDIDADTGESSVVLTDGAGLRRAYYIPSDWTGDLSSGEPGQATLELTTFASQRGDSLLATTEQEPGFDPFSVVRMEVQIDGPGAIDDVVLSTGIPLASATVRNGSGVNPVHLGADTGPVLGAPWTASLACPGTFAVFEIRPEAAVGPLTPFGEVLVHGPLVQRTRVVPALGQASLTWQTPSDPLLAGLELSVQGLCWGATPAGPRVVAIHGRLSNALDVVVGY